MPQGAHEIAAAALSVAPQILSPNAHITKLCVPRLCMCTTSNPSWVDAEQHVPLGRTQARYLDETLRRFHTPSYPAKHLLSLSRQMAGWAVSFLPLLAAPAVL